MANAMQRFKQSGVKKLPVFQGREDSVSNVKEGRKYLGQRPQRQPQNKVKQARGSITNATEGVLKQRQAEYKDKNNNKPGAVKVAKMNDGARQVVGKKAMNKKGGLMGAVKKIIQKKLDEKQYLSD